MESPEGRRGGQWLCSPHAAGPECGAEGGASRLLRAASSLPPRRLRDLEVHRARSRRRAWSTKVFEYGTWGGEFRSEFAPQPGDIVAHEHWCSSGFANTDLDLQLKKHGIHQLIVIGLIAHTCVEATVRFAAELGYDVTVVRDATASYSDDEMHAALDVNLPNYASAIVTTNEVVDVLSSRLGNQRAILLLGDTSMAETINQNRRRILAATAMTIAARTFPKARSRRRSPARRARSLRSSRSMPVC